MTAVIVDFAGRQFASNPSYSGGTFAYPLTKGGFTGWDGGASTRHAQIERPWGHGAFPSRVLRADRLVTLEGLVIGDSPRDLKLQMEFLAALPAEYGRLAVTERGMTRWALAVPNLVECDRPQATDRMARFRVELWCPEPWKYGDERVFTARFGGSVKARQYGTVPAAPVVRVTGPATGSQVTVKLAGRSMRVLGAIPANDFVEVDCRSGVARNKRGQVLSRRVFGDLLDVPTGTEATMSVTGSGSGSVTATVTDTYV